MFFGFVTEVIVISTIRMDFNLVVKWMIECILVKAALILQCYQRIAVFKTDNTNLKRGNLLLFDPLAVL